MAEAPRAHTISPLNKLFRNLAKGLNEDDVNEMKDLLRGEQVSKKDMDKLRSAMDIFHHLKENGDIDGNNLDLLVELFEEMGKEPLKDRVCNFQREHSATTESTVCELPKRGRPSEGSRHSSKQHMQTSNLPSMTGEVTVVINEEEEKESRQLSLEERRLKLREKNAKVALQENLGELVRKYINSVPENDTAKLAECMKTLKEYGADLSEVKKGSLLFILSFLTEEELDYFWQKYKDGTVEKALTNILIPTDIRDKAEEAGIAIIIKLKIDEKEYKEVKQKMHEMSAVSSAFRATWRRDTVCSKWEAFVMDQVQDKKQAGNLIAQSKFDPVVDALTQEEFFFPCLVSFWFENSFTFPPTVTKATEYAVIQHAEMYCKENNVKVEDFREIIKVRFNEMGKYLYDHITAENAGKMYLSWIDTSISNLESHFFGLLTKSDDCYTFQSKYVYSYIIATYFSNIAVLSPSYIPVLLREEKIKILQANLSYCFPYVTGILGEKALCFLKEVVKFCETQVSVNINNLGLVGNCLFESERPSVFAGEIEKVVGQNYTLNLSTCTGISNKTIHALSVILQYTSLIKDINLYSETDEAFLSSEFKECLTNIIGDPLAVDRCTVTINNSHDFTVTAILFRILSLLCKHAKSGSDTTPQPAVISLTISSNGNALEGTRTCTIEEFIKALSYMPKFEKLNLTGLGQKFCEQFLLCVSKETVILNISTLCLAGNGLSWKHCRLLLEALNALPCVAVLDLSRNSIGSLGCTILLPIGDQIDVRVDDNNISHGLPEILPLCTSTEELPDVGDHTLESLGDVASFIRNLENVRHIDCTKLSNSQLSKLSQNLSLLCNILSVDVSGSELSQQITLLLSESLKHLKELKRVALSHCCVSTDDMKVFLQGISPEITDLNLSKTNISGILLTEFKRFRSLKYLNLSNNNLKANDHIFRFIPTSLTQLNLSHNDLHGCSFEKFDSYTQLKVLDVTHNKLTVVDMQTILKLISTSVHSLNVSHNNLKRMEESFQHLTQLKQLNLSNNGLESCINLSLPSSITQLNLSHNKISTISRSVNILSQLTYLDISHNKIIQSLVGILQYLPKTSRYLDLSSNRIENVASVGNVISHFNDLQFINLGSNMFFEIGIQSLLNDIKDKDLLKINISHNFTLMHHIIDQLPKVSINLKQDNIRLIDVESSSIFNNLMQVTELNVSGLSKENCSEICESLILLAGLTKLALTECCVRDVWYLIRGIKHLHNLTYLDLSNNQFDNVTIHRIVRVLPSTLISLNLSHNMAKSELNLKHLTKLMRLDVSHNRLNVPMYTLLSNIPPKIQYLDVGCNKIQNVKHIGELISSHSHLSYINMSSNRIGAFGVQILFSEIENCDTNCDIDVSHNLAGLQKIIPYIIWQPTVSSSLPDFDRGNLTLKDKKLQDFFRNISKITAVDIPQNEDWSQIDYDSVWYDLTVFDSLERLRLAISYPSACHNLAGCLTCFTNLRHFDISGSNIHIQNVEAILNSLLLLKRLQYVNFSKINIDLKGMEVLLKIQQKHVSQPFINIAHNVNYLPAIVPYIKDQLSGSSIEGIDFNSIELPIQSLADVVQITKLTKLTVKEKHWVDEDFKSFLQGLNNLNLEYLALSYNNIGDSGAKSLSELIMSLHRITHLDLSHNNIGYSGAKSLSEVMRSMDGLTHLDLSHNKIGDSGAMSLSKGMRWRSRLAYLDLSYNNIGDIGAKSLCEGMWSMHRPAQFYHRLHNRRYSAERTFTEESRSLHKVVRPMFLTPWSMDGLTHLDLSHNNIGDRGAKSLSEGMRSMRRFIHLDLSHNNIGDSGAKSLSEGILSMRRFIHLDLSHNNIGDSGAKSLSEMMGWISRLTQLDLSHHNIEDSVAKSLSEGMRSMDGLTHLDLSHNNIGDSGAENLSEVIRSMGGLTHLDLSHNNIGDSGAENLSEVIRSMDGLTHFDLSHNNIGDSGAQSLSEGMRPIRRHSGFNLSRNFGADVVGSLSKMLLAKHRRTQYSRTKSYDEGITLMKSFGKSQAVSKKEKATHEPVQTAMFYSKEEHN